MEDNFYKELALRAYSNIFPASVHIIIHTLDETKDAILEYQRLLPNKLHKYLFQHELADLIESNKLTVAFNQKIQFDEYLMTDYKRIRELYNWLKEQYTSDINKAATDIWIADRTLLSQLTDALVDKKLINISQKSVFEDLFVEKSINEIVDWRGSRVTLIYLIEQLKLHKLIDPNAQNMFIKTNFYVGGKEIANIRQVKSSIIDKKEKQIKGGTDIGSIVRILVKAIP